MPEEVKIREVIKDYIQRMIKSHTTREGVTTDRHIDCPKCGGHRTIFWSGGRRGYWNKCWKCGFKFEFPETLTVPGPDELEEILEIKDKERRINDVVRAIQELGINI